MDAIELTAGALVGGADHEPDLVIDPAAGSISVTGQDFDDLYRREYSTMVRISYLMVRDDDLAVEVTHDAFARVLERWNRLDEPGAYLRTAVVNASRDALRRRIFRRSRRHVIEVVDAGAHAPEDYLLDALDQLAPKRRAAVVLRYYLDLPEAEIAAALGVRPGTVKSLLHRGLAELRAALADDQTEGSPS
jgi:RNA polymerase sigma-70 factor (sigma-E family)